jgi:hypothetical protein
MIGPGTMTDVLTLLLLKCKYTVSQQWDGFFNQMCYKSTTVLYFNDTRYVKYASSRVIASFNCKDINKQFMFHMTFSPRSRFAVQLQHLDDVKFFFSYFLLVTFYSTVESMGINICIN